MDVPILLLGRKDKFGRSNLIKIKLGWILENVGIISLLFLLVCRYICALGCIYNVWWDQPVWPAGPKSAQVWGRSEKHCGQSHQGTQHGENSKGTCKTTTYTMQVTNNYLMLFDCRSWEWHGPRWNLTMRCTRGLGFSWSVPVKNLLMYWKRTRHVIKITIKCIPSVSGK